MRPTTVSRSFPVSSTMATEANGDGHRSLAAAVTEYLADIKLNKKHKTHAAYSTALAYFLESCKKTHLEDIDRRDLLKFSGISARREEPSAKVRPQQIFKRVGFLRSQGITEKNRQEGRLAAVHRGGD